jgi:hypothetical protein
LSCILLEIRALSGSLEVTTEEPTPTESYPSSPDNEVPDVDIPEIDYENWPYAMMECKLIIIKRYRKFLFKFYKVDHTNRMFEI